MLSARAFLRQVASVMGLARFGMVYVARARISPAALWNA